MIKRVLMISDNDIESKQSLGVTKKLLGQYKAFQNLGYDTYHLCFKNGEGVLIHGNKTTVIVKRQAKLFITYGKLLKSADKICKENGIDFCYIRYPLADLPFVCMIKKLHKICKVVIEIPTYPYDAQNRKSHGLFSKYKIISDKFFRTKLKKYSISFAVLSDDTSVFGVPCINISNGVNIETINFIGDKIAFDDSIHLIAVAVAQRDHGFDRVIKGLYSYYKNGGKNITKVYFNIVGNGPETPYLKELVKDLALSDYVFFSGTKFGKELDELFSKSNLAVAGMGLHRSGIKKSAVLKTREYCARGIPFITSTPDDGFPFEIDFCKMFPANDDDININEIVDFFDFLKAQPNLSLQMRKYAEENLTWEKQLQKILENI